MKIKINHNEQIFNVDLSKPMDISIPLISGQTGPNCFYAPLFETSPYKDGDFIGDTRNGSPVNFYNVKLNPHGNGTHVECVGHISKERVSINNCLKNTHHIAKLISLYPQKVDNGDRIITKDIIKNCLEDLDGEQALLIRTMPNTDDKKNRNYSGTNPPYFSPDAIGLILDAGIKHLLTDLPSIDREEDGGNLTGHKTFWGYPQILDLEKTITELVYITDEIEDGTYFLNFQIPPFDLDAAPCKIVLYKMVKEID